MKYKNFFILILSALLYFANTQIIWWIYDKEDHDKIVDPSSKENKDFLTDQTTCSMQSGNCNAVNSELQSDPPFNNQCCHLKFSSYLEGCHVMFSGKYRQTNLYSLERGNDGFSYDCDGRGFKTYDSSSFTSNQKWEITIKEKLDCIYSKDENECKSNLKSFKQNTKCCWFTNDKYLSFASCFGMSEITDDEFNRTIPYLTLASYASSDGQMDFRCYDKSDKVVKGKYNLKFYISEMGSVEEKLAQELLSDDCLEIFSKKQNFIKIKEYDKSLTNSFQIWTVSPNRDPKKYTVSVKFSYTITDSLTKIRKLQTKTVETLARCTPIEVDDSTDLNITTSECELSNDDNYPIDKIEIQPGHDLIGNFDEENNVATPGTNNSDDDIKEMKDAVTFIFKDPITNLNSTVIEGEISEDRKNVEFIIYHQKDEQTVELVKGKADFLKNSTSVNITTEPEINFSEGTTIIPNQLVKSEDGKYLYIQNKIAKRDGNYNNTIIDNEPGDEEPGDYDYNDYYRYRERESSGGLSNGGIAAIIVVGCVVLAAIVIATILMKKKTTSVPPYNNSSSNVVINN